MIKTVDVKTVDGGDWAAVDQNTVDAKAFAAAGYELAGLRAAVCYWDFNHGAYALVPDACFVSEAAALRAAGVTVVPYYFGIYAKGAPLPASQHANAVAGMAGIIPGVDLPPCVDFEWESFHHLNQTPEVVCELLNTHVKLLVDKYGTAMVYSSGNEFYDLGAAVSRLSQQVRDAILWCKTAYPVGAGQPRYNGPLMLPHIAPDVRDPHGYFQVPTPWAARGARIQQTQGDARGIPGISHQADLNRFLCSMLGDAGPEVAELQGRLNMNHSETLFVDGKFGPRTDAAVRRLQAKYGQTQDGIAWPKTYARAVWPASRQ